MRRIVAFLVALSLSLSAYAYAEEKKNSPTCHQMTGILVMYLQRRKVGLLRVTETVSYGLMMKLQKRKRL